MVQPWHNRPLPEPDPLPETYSYSPILGFRSWNLTDGLLKGAWSMGWQYPWMEAQCWIRNGRVGRELGHASPYEYCTCGIYATKAPYGSYPYPVLGLVAMEDVIEGETGYRAARAWVLAWTFNTRHMEYGTYATGSSSHGIRRQLKDMFPSIDVPRHPEALSRVLDYYTHNPDKIPSLKEVQDGHWQATKKNPPRNTSFPFRAQPESEETWRARTGYTYTFTQGANNTWTIPGA